MGDGIVVTVTDDLRYSVRRIVSSWMEFAALVENHCDGWIFRGVSRVEHKLIPKIGRPDSRKNPRTGGTLPFSHDEEIKILNEFRRVGRPYLPSHDLNNLELMAIAQHHGMPTRLLDWSDSPLVAAFFAADSAGTKGIPAIYAVGGLAETTGGEDPFSLEDVRIYRPPHVSPRIPAQQALFTVHPSPEAEELAPRSEIWELHDKSRTGFWLKRILDQCGFNRASMFPDLDGLAHHLGWRYKWGL
jgi:hypothetical protein